MVEFQLLSGILAKKGGDFDPADIFTGNMMGTGFEQKDPVAVFQFRDAGGSGQISVEIAFMVCQNNAETGERNILGNPGGYFAEYLTICDYQVRS